MQGWGAQEAGRDGGGGGVKSVREDATHKREGQKRSETKRVNASDTLFIADTLVGSLWCAD